MREVFNWNHIPQQMHINSIFFRTVSGYLDSEIIPQKLIDRRYIKMYFIGLLVHQYPYCNKMHPTASAH